MKITFFEQFQNFYIIKKISSIVKTVMIDYNIRNVSIIVMFLSITYILLYPMLKMLTRMFNNKNKNEQSSSHRLYKKLSSSFCSNSSCSESSTSKSSSTKKCKKNKCKKNKCEKNNLTKQEVKKTLRNYKLN